MVFIKALLSMVGKSMMDADGVDNGNVFDRIGVKVEATPLINWIREVAATVATVSSMETASSLLMEVVERRRQWRRRCP